MQIGLLTIAAPLALAALILLGWSIGGIVRQVRNKTLIGLRYCVPLVVSLLLICSFTCLYVLLSAALSHSEAAKQAVLPTSLLCFLLLVIFPGATLILIRSLQSKAKNQKP